jgi:hypothetical protein
MTKSKQIMRLGAAGRTTKQIACEVYGLSEYTPSAELKSRMAYVRTALRQRRGKGVSDNDRAYLIRRFGGTSTADAWRRRAAYYRQQKRLFPDIQETA